MSPARSNRWHLLSREEIRQRQVTKLASYLRRVVLPHCSAHRERLEQAGFSPSQLRTPDDLRRIPTLSKADFSSPEAVRSFILTPDPERLARQPGTVMRALMQGRDVVQQELSREFRPILMTTTTGRAAEPVPFLYTARDIDILSIAGERIMRVTGASPGDRMLNLFPYAPHLAFWIAHYAGTAFGAMMISTGGGKTIGTEGNLRMLRKFEPKVLIGLPTFLYHFMTAAVEDGVRLPGLRKMVLGGEKAPLGMKRKLAALAGKLGAERVDILTTYGFTEARMAWSECQHAPGEASTGYHLSPELALIEVIDPETGEPRGEGEPGEIVFTPLEGRGSVVLRFRTGDLISGGLVHERCPNCGRNVPRLIGEISRRSEIREMRLEKLKGTLVDFNLIEHLLDGCEPLESWQLELLKRNHDPMEIDEIVLHVHARSRYGENEIRVAIDRALLARLEVRVNRLEFHTAEEMRVLHGVGRELKEVRIVDRRPGGRHAPPESTVLTGEAQHV